MDIVLMILATWRISSLIANEDGPRYIFAWFRGQLGIEEELNDKGIIVRVVPDRFAPQMISCVWCISMWIGAVFFLLPPPLAQSIALPFAFSTGAIIIDNYLSGG